MAVAYVRDAGLKTTTGGNNPSGSFASLPSVGNHIFVGMSTNMDVTTITDNQTPANSYNRDNNKTQAGTWSSFADQFSTKVATSAGTYTISWTASAVYAAWTAVEFSGVAAASWLDQIGSDSNTTTEDAHATASGANTTAAGVAIGVAAVNNNDSDINISDTPPSGYTNIQYSEDGINVIGYSMVYKIYSSSETSSAQWSHDNVIQYSWAAIIATYKAAGGDYTVSKSEGVTLAESKTVALSSSAISKSEGTTLGEASTIRLQALISKSEGVTLGESSAVTLSDLKINKSEGVTVGDDEADVILANNLTVSKSEGVTLGESNTQKLSDLVIGKSEGVTLGEVKVITLPDALVIGKSEGVTLGESSNVIEQVEGEYNLSVSDGVTIADGGAILMGDLGIAIDPAYLIYWSAGVEVV